MLGEAVEGVKIHPTTGMPVTCFLCARLYLDTGSPAWSDLTPGSDFEMSCSAKHFDYGLRDEIPWESTIFKAQTCGDFHDRDLPSSPAP